MIAPQGQTGLLAKQAAQLDVLTGGKLRLGLGVGIQDACFEALGMEFRGRGRRFEEQIELLRRFWTEEVVDFDGNWHRVDGAGINPLPIQRPIPIWNGAFNESGLRRAARLADGWFDHVPLDGGNDWRPTIQQLRQWVTEAGRDPGTFGIEIEIRTRLGGPDDWAPTAEQFIDLGLSHVGIATARAGLTTIDQHLERLGNVKAMLEAKGVRAH